MLYGLFPFSSSAFDDYLSPLDEWRPLTRAHYVPVFIAMSAGMLLFYLGLFTTTLLAALGIAVLLLGWGRGLLVLFHVYMSTPPGDKRHETVLNGALTGGWLGALSYLLWLLSDSTVFVNFSMQAGPWLYLLPVFFTVCHRMIPFFGSCVLPDYRMVKPSWSLPVLVLCVCGHLILELMSARAWLFLFDVPLAAMAIYHSMNWDPRRALRIRLLAVLHIAFAWLGIGMALYALQSLVLLLTGELILGRSPLHALGIGFFAAMVVGMVTRVTLGHSGRQLFADSFTWVCFLGVNVVAVLRISAELWSGIGWGYMNSLAALAWLGFLGAWVWRYAPIYWRPRADGMAG